MWLAVCLLPVKRIANAIAVENTLQLYKITKVMNSKILLSLFLLFCFQLPNFAVSQTVTHVPLYTFRGDIAGDAFGTSVSGAGDVDGDGRADLIVGSSNSGIGIARVLSGIDGSTIFTFSGGSDGDRFGSSVSGAGDADGDGRADLIVGADRGPNNLAGSARVFSGNDGSTLFTFSGDDQLDGFGNQVSGAGDVNGDGRADLIVSALFDDNNGSESGSARVLSGIDGSTLYTFNGNDAGDRFGRSVSGAGDVNGDGRADLIVGANLDSANGVESGSARVLSGIDGSVLHAVVGDSAGDQFGVSVSGAGDVNGDGLADLIVGADGDDNNGFSSGSARVFSGSNGSVLFTFNGESPFDFFGGAVSTAGDVNGDGLADLIVGGRLADNNGSGSGLARVFSGADGSTIYTFNGDSAGDEFGSSVSGAGDINGDGFADFIVGARGGDYARVFVSRTSSVPEPSSGILLALIGGGLSLLRRKRNSNH